MRFKNAATHKVHILKIFNSNPKMEEHTLTDVFDIWSVRLSVVFYLWNLTDQKTHFLAICVTDNLTDAYFT